jgi:hypothetical protein
MNESTINLPSLPAWANPNLIPTHVLEAVNEAGKAARKVYLDIVDLVLAHGQALDDVRQALTEVPDDGFDPCWRACGAGDLDLALSRGADLLRAAAEGRDVQQVLDRQHEVDALD